MTRKTDTGVNQGAAAVRFSRRVFVRTVLHAIDILQGIATFFPPKYVFRFAAFLGSVVGKFCKKDIDVSLAQLQFVFPEGIPVSAPERHASVTNASEKVRSAEQALGEAHGIIRESYRHVGQSIGELFLWNTFLRPETVIPNGAHQEQRTGTIGDQGLDVIDELVKGKQVAVGLSAHFGSFELLAAYLSYRGLKCSIIGRTPNYFALAKAVREFREAYGVSMIWSEAVDAPRQIVQAVRDGRVLCAMIDQDTKWKSEFSPFFGLEAASPIAPIQLALRYGLPVFTSFIVRTCPLRHEVSTELIEHDPADPQVMSKILRTFNERLEARIRLYPEQYIWWHRRWRRRPGIDYDENPHLLRGQSAYTQWLDEKRLEQQSD